MSKSDAVAAARALLDTFPENHKDAFSAQARKVIKDLIAELAPDLDKVCFEVQVKLEGLSLGRGIQVRGADMARLNKLAEDRSISMTSDLTAPSLTFWVVDIDASAATERIDDLLADAVIYDQDEDDCRSFDHLVSDVVASPYVAPVS